jgi:putative transposase
MDRLLDEGRTGPTYLRMNAVAQVVVDAIRLGAGHYYTLHAWVVMPNHVHLLFTPHVPVSVLMQRLKGGTARQANKLLNQTGRRFWQDESYDHLVRNSEEFPRIERYIVQNPVRAGLAMSAEEYPWSGISQTG